MDMGGGMLGFAVASSSTMATTLAHDRKDSEDKDY